MYFLSICREVWPEGDIFGANDISPEDEFMALREIHFTNLNGKVNNDISARFYSDIIFGFKT